MITMLPLRDNGLSEAGIPLCGVEAAKAGFQFPSLEGWMPQADGVVAALD
jgi:hypothetical protein